MFNFFYQYHNTPFGDDLFSQYAEQGIPPNPESDNRITEDGQNRITQDSQQRITE